MKANEGVYLSTLPAPRVESVDDVARWMREDLPEILSLATCVASARIDPGLLEHLICDLWNIVDALAAYSDADAAPTFGVLDEQPERAAKLVAELLRSDFDLLAFQGAMAYALRGSVSQNSVA